MGKAVALAGCLNACSGSGATKTVVEVHAAPAVTAVPSALGGLQRSFVSVIDRTAPEVVQIADPQGLGSGVVFDRLGDVVTNAHVVAGGGPFRVTDSAGHTYSAAVVGTFPPDDIAVVRAQGGSYR